MAELLAISMASSMDKLKVLSMVYKTVELMVEPLVYMLA